MGSTSFLGFSYPNLLFVFPEPVRFTNLYNIFLATVGTFSGSFLLRAFSGLPICMLHQFGLGRIKNGAL